MNYYASSTGYSCKCYFVTFFSNLLPFLANCYLFDFLLPKILVKMMEFLRIRVGVRVRVRVRIRIKVRVRVRIRFKNLVTKIW